MEQFQSMQNNGYLVQFSRIPAPIALKTIKRPRIPHLTNVLSSASDIKESSAEFAMAPKPPAIPLSDLTSKPLSTSSKDRGSFKVDGLSLERISLTKPENTGK